MTFLIHQPLLHLLVESAAPLGAEEPIQNTEKLTTKDNYLLKEDDGTVIYVGKYTTSAGGVVIRYDIYNKKTNEIVQSEIPIYDASGSIVLNKVYNGIGELILVSVTIDKKPVHLSPEGEVMEGVDAYRLMDPRLRD